MKGLRMLSHDEARSIIERGDDVALFAMVSAEAPARDPEQTALPFGDDQEIKSFPDWLETRGVGNHGHIASAVRYHWEIERGHFGSPAPTAHQLVAHYERMVDGLFLEVAKGYSTLPGSPVVPYALALAILFGAEDENDAVAFLESVTAQGEGAVKILGRNPWADLTRPVRAERVLTLWREYLEAIR